MGWALGCDSCMDYGVDGLICALSYLHIRIELLGSSLLSIFTCLDGSFGHVVLMLTPLDLLYSIFHVNRIMNLKLILGSCPQMRDSEKEGSAHQVCSRREVPPVIPSLLAIVVQTTSRTSANHT